MARRMAVVGAAVAVLALAVSMVGPALSDENGERRTIRLLDKFADDEENVTFVDVGDQGESIGDYFVFDDVVFNPAGTQRRGRDTGNCLTVGEGVLECEVTFHLSGGSIRAEGTFEEAEGQGVAAVTGGTGAYKTAHGQVRGVFTDVGIQFTIKVIL
jgi:hypothetical protein